MVPLLIAAMVTSFTAATGVTALLVRYASRLSLLDVPNERSSHTTPTPRGGGLGVIAGVATGLTVLLMSGNGPGRALGAVLIASAAVAAVGAIDDLHSLPAVTRLGAHTIVATGVVIVLGPVGQLPLPPPLDVPLGWLATPLTILWLVGVTNFFNFMDGIDALAGLQAMATCIGLMVAAFSLDTQRFALVLAAAATGFLLFNRPQARIFLGDIGSTSIGFALAATPLAAPIQLRPIAALTVGIGLSLFLLDPLETLVRLALGRYPLGAPHRMHSYQRLARATANRAATAGVIGTVGAILAIGGGLAYRNPWMFWPVLVLAIALFSIEKILADRLSPQATVDPRPAVGPR